LKISTLPQAIVAAAGILAVAAVVVSLALAGWSPEAIVGFGILAATQFVALYLQTRRTAVVEAKTDQQTEQLDTIVRQTNGMTDEDRARVAEEAADLAAVKIVAAYNRGEMGGPR
jgi:Flp pilus assembly protein TadB